MLEYLNSLIKTIVIVMILGMILEVFIPRGDLRKYVKMVMGLVVLLLILQPILNIFDYEYNTLNVIPINNSFPTKQEILNKGKLLEDKNLNLAVSAYKQNIEGQIKKIAETHKNVESAEVMVNLYDNEEQQKLGLIKNVEMYLVLGDKEEQKSGNIKPVEKVDIQVSINNDKNSIGDFQRTEFVEKQKGFINGIKKIISDLYKIPPEKIKIYTRTTREG